jgi:transcriptional regulator with XRE-family HTH domain
MNKSEKKAALAERHRKALRFWQAELCLKTASWCKRAGISEGTLRNFLSGVSATIEIDTLEALAEAIGKSIGELLDMKPDDAQARPEVTESGLIGAIQGIIHVLIARKLAREADFESVFSFQMRDYGSRNQQGAAEVMRQLLEFVQTSPSESAAPATRISRPPERARLKKDKS